MSTTRNLPRDTGMFYIIAHKRNGLPGARNLYVKRVYEDREGTLRIKWTDNKGDAKTWMTEVAAQRNALHLGIVQVTYR